MGRTIYIKPVINKRNKQITLHPSKKQLGKDFLKDFGCKKWKVTFEDIL